MLWKFVGQGVTLSKQRCIISPVNRVAHDDIVKILKQFNEDHSDCEFTRLTDSSGKSDWSSPRSGQRLGPPRPLGASAPDDSDMWLSFLQCDPNRYNEFGAKFLSGARAVLERAGYDCGVMNPHHWQVPRRVGEAGKFLLTGFTMEAARTLYITFREYTWVSGGDAVVISLQCPKVADELMTDAAARAMSARTTVLSQMDSWVISRRSLPWITDDAGRDRQRMVAIADAPRQQPQYGGGSSTSPEDHRADRADDSEL